MPAHVKKKPKILTEQFNTIRTIRWLVSAIGW